jgi:hypothetical protein
MGEGAGGSAGQSAIEGALVGGSTAGEQTEPLGPYGQLPVGSGEGTDVEGAELVGTFGVSPNESGRLEDTVCEPPVMPTARITQAPGGPGKRCMNSSSESVLATFGAFELLPSVPLPADGGVDSPEFRE